MKSSYRKGLTFGLTSGIITTLGLIIGLNAGTHSKLVILGGILTIAIADSFSDALGIHISEEADKRTTHKQAWQATASTFCFKIIFALTFVIPITLLQLNYAIMASIVWGMLLLAIVSYYIAKEKKKAPWKSILEHLMIAAVVILLTNWVGGLISHLFV